ncbi:MAG: esterase-like activity of phytase family protein [Bacteroidales bacterium]|jgi:hypothetical protein|nr:esterase-like activity of phytase family protein [Bacteroidales bacterium]
MIKHIFFYLLSITLIQSWNVSAQPEIKNKPVLSKVIDVYENYDPQTAIGGLSAIEYSGYKNIYYAVADKPPLRIYTLRISLEETLDYQIIDTLVFPDLTIEAEAFRIMDSLSCFFVSDEKNTNTSIYKFYKNNIQKIETIPTHKNIMRYNSGYEGVALNTNKTRLYLALERPAKKEKRQKHHSSTEPYISIFEFDLNKGIVINEYAYPLVNPSGDNGVSEILTLNDSIMLVMERAWTNKRSIVTINTINLKATNKSLKGNDPDSNAVRKVFPKTILDFRSIEKKFTDYPNYNLEGMTLAHTGKHLVFITDNNFNPSQTTYLIALEISF